jgi:hypothetical protein
MVVSDVGEHCVPGLVGVGAGVCAIGGLFELERAPLADCCGWQSGATEMAEDVSFPGFHVV